MKNKILNKTNYNYTFTVENFTNLYMPYNREYEKENWTET